MLRLPGSRCSIEPLTKVSLTCDWIPSRSRSRSANRRLPPLPSRRRQSSAALPKPTIAGTFSVPERMPRSCPPPSICAVMRTRGLRRTYSAPTPFGPVHLVRRQRRQVDARRVDVERDLADALDRVDVEERALLLDDRADLLDRVDGADLVVGEHDRDQDRLVGHRRSHRRRVDASVLLDRQVGDVEALFLEALAGVEHRLVLGLRRDDVVAAVLVELRGALDRQVVGLGRARGPDDLLAAGADERPDLLARVLDRLLRRPAEAVRRLAALPKTSVKYGSIASTTRGSTARGGVVVHVDRELEIVVSF